MQETLVRFLGREDPLDLELSVVTKKPHRTSCALLWPVRETFLAVRVFDRVAEQLALEPDFLVQVFPAV